MGKQNSQNLPLLTQSDSAKRKHKNVGNLWTKDSKMVVAICDVVILLFCMDLFNHCVEMFMWCWINKLVVMWPKVEYLRGKLSHSFYDVRNLSYLIT